MDEEESIDEVSETEQPVEVPPANADEVHLEAPATASAPAKKTAKKVAAAKKARRRVKKSSAKKGAARRATTPSTQPANFPRHSVEKALRIPKAIYDQNAGKPVTVAEAAKFTTGGTANGVFRLEVSSAKKYGFLKSVEGGKIVPEARARQAISPQTDTDRLTALRDAVLSAPELSDVYSHYRGENLPDDQFFKNALRVHESITRAM